MLKEHAHFKTIVKRTCPCGETDHREVRSYAIYLSRTKNKEIKFRDMFKSPHVFDCAVCFRKTSQIDTNSYHFSDDSRFLVIRLHTYEFNNNSFHTLKSDITEIDIDRVIIPNQQNIIFKLNSAIGHIGADHRSGHYICWCRKLDKWQRISDTDCRNYSSFIKNLKGLYLLFLERI